MRTSGFFKALFTLYFVAVFVYLIYCFITRSGLFGSVIGLLLDRFGEADLNIAALISMLILIVPAAILMGILRRVGVMAPPQPRTVTPRRGALLRQWLTLFVIALLVAGLSVAAYFIVNQINREDQTRTIYALNLDRTVVLPASDVKFIAITGTLQFDYAYQLETTTAGDTTTENFIPLTAARWKTNQPITYFINTSLNGITTDKGFALFPDSGPFAGVFEGQLSQNSLPSFVAQKYEQSGLSLAKTYYVLNHQPFYQGKVGNDSATYILIPVIGIGLGVAILLGGTFGILIRGLRRR